MKKILSIYICLVGLSVISLKWARRFIGCLTWELGSGLCALGYTRIGNALGLYKAGRWMMGRTIVTRVLEDKEFDAWLLRKVETCPNRVKLADL